MAVFKKGPSWVAQVYTGTDPTTGRKCYLSRSARTRKEARELEADLRTKVAQGKLKATPKRTLADLLDRWLTTADLSPSTAYNYRRVVEKRVKPALGDLPIRSVTTERLDAYYLKLREEGLKPLTVRNVHAILRSGLAQGVRWGWLATNPATLANPGRVGTTEVEVPALEAIAAVLAEAENTDPDLHAMLWFTATTGARRGEVCGLRWADLDLDGQAVTIRRSVVDPGGRKTVGDTKTHQTRRLSLDGVCVALLRSLKARQAERLLALGAHLSTDAYVYSLDVAGADPISPNVLSDRFAAVCKRAGVRMGLHGLRHASATHLIAAGTDVRTVAARLGHSDASLTLRVYAHAVEQRDRDAAEVMGGLLKPRTA